MKSYRFRIIALWLVISIALLIYPGYEVKGFIFGMIIGWWPFALLGTFSPIPTLLAIFALSAFEVWICAWLMDKYQISRKYMIAVAIFTLTCAIIAYVLGAGQFINWKYGVVSLTMPEGHELTLSDFRRLYLIPVTLAGGMIGLYLAVAIGTILAAGKSLLKKRIEQSVPGYPPQGVGSPDP